jgi:hypothetical protein
MPLPSTKLGLSLPLAESARIRAEADRRQLTLSAFLRQAAARACEEPEK